jgi:hypothetical protein
MLSSSILKPGDKGTIRAAISTTEFVGSISKTVEVFSNDPQRPLIKLVLKAFMNPPDMKAR